MRWIVVVVALGWAGAAHAGAMEDCTKHVKCLDYYDCEDPSLCTSKCKPPSTELWTKLEKCGVQYSCSKVFDFEDYAACLQKKCAAHWEKCVGPDEPEGCGDVSWKGECDGDTVLWCEGGEVLSLDCAEDGQACGWSDEGGYYDCVDESGGGGGCGGLTAEGECDGARVRWCEGGSVRSLDCGEGGESCGWSDEGGYYDCVEDGGGGGTGSGGSDAGSGGGTDSGGASGGSGGTGGESSGGGGASGGGQSGGGSSPSGVIGGPDPTPTTTTTTTRIRTEGCESREAPLGVAGALLIGLALLSRRPGGPRSAQHVSR